MNDSSDDRSLRTGSGARPLSYGPIALAGFLMVLGYGLLFILGPAAADAYVEEDRIVESLGAAGLLATSIIFLLILLRGRRADQFGPIKQLALILLVILFFVGAGEEISWGQRILGLSTPEGLKDSNTQQELNFHNLDTLSGWLRVERLFQVFWFSFGVLIPIAAAASQRVRATLDPLLPILPVWSAVFLVANQLLGYLADLVDNAHPALYEGLYYPFEGARVEVYESGISVVLAVGAFALLKRTAPR